MATIARFLFDTEFNAPAVNAAEQEAIREERFAPQFSEAQIRAAQASAEEFRVTTVMGEETQEVDTAKSPASTFASRSDAQNQEDDAGFVLPPPPAPLVYTEEEMNEAKNQSFDEGHYLATQQAKDALDVRMTEVVTSFTETLRQIVSNRAEDQKEMMENAVLLSLSIVYKLFPSLAIRNAQAEIERMVATCMLRMPDEAKLIVTIHKGLAALMEKDFDALAIEHGFKGRIVLVSDPEVPPGDCQIEWEEGGAERNQAALLSEIETLLTHSMTDAEKKREMVRSEMLHASEAALSHDTNKESKQVASAPMMAP